MIELVEVSKSFGGVVALQDVSLEVAAGEFVAVLGPSGCGKTTLLRAIGGYVSVDCGAVRLGGADVTASAPEARRVGMVFQDYALFPHMTVLENVEFGLKMRGEPKAGRQQKARSVLALTGMDGTEQRRPFELSGGQQQRVAVARAIAQEPDALLLDEPLANLDRNVRLRLRDELRELQQRLKLPTILVTHDQEEALGIADRTAIMNHGRIVQIGGAFDLTMHPAEPFVSEFLGLAE
jgi:putative spermidine/putrescine transport system ATP-binding protein